MWSQCLFQSEYPSPLQAGQWETMVCGVDKNGDGKIGLDEFTPIYIKIQQGDTSFLQEIFDTCASKKHQNHALDNINYQQLLKYQQQQQQRRKQQREQTPAPAGSSNSATQSANVQQHQQQQGQQEEQQQTPAGGSNSISINVILFTLASLMATIWK